MMKILAAALAALLLTSCGLFGAKNEKKAETPILCGGYTDQRVPETEEIELFRKATAGLTGVVYTPETVATQVVAGTNYRFVCKAVTMAREPETYQAEVTVFKPLPGRGEPKVTGIKRL